MAEDFISRPRTRPRTWDRLFALEAPRGRGQGLKDTPLG